MDAKELNAQRNQMLKNVFNIEHNDRVMLGSNSYTWSICDAGYKLTEAMYDYDKLEKVTRRHAEIYNFDIYTDVQNRNPIRVSSLLGGGKTHIDNEKQSIWCDDRVLMSADEYQDWLEDETKFMYTKIFRRSVKEGLKIGELKTAMREWDMWRAANAYRNNMLVNEYGALLYFSTFPRVPVEQLCQQFRGIKEFSLDLRRHASEILEISDRMYAVLGEPVWRGAVDKKSNGSYFGSFFGGNAGLNAYVADLTFAMLAHTVLNRKQFEKFYWPYFKPALDYCAEKGARTYIHVEGDGLRFSDFFQDYPKGVILMHLELDDPREVRKALPNIAIAGGMPSTMLATGTKEQCINYAKALIDDIGDGFVLDQDKMLSFPTDCNGENLKAVNDFAREYKF